MAIEFDPSILVAFDFDGTLTTKDILGGIAPLKPYALFWLRQLQKLPIITILYTCRHDEGLKPALDLLESQNIRFDIINDDNHKRNSGRKINADVYIDDKANDGHIRWFRTYLRVYKLCRKNKHIDKHCKQCYNMNTKEV